MRAEAHLEILILGDIVRILSDNLLRYGTAD